MSAPTISIIVPVYNAEKYLDRCIGSLLNQDYPSTEIVLVNDGSTDGSRAICQSFADKFPGKIRLINQQNTGASIARKNGIDAASGQYMMFADSDDFVSQQYVSALYEALIKSNAEIALCPVKRIAIGEAPDFATRITTRTMQSDELFRRFFKYEFWGYVCGIYRRSVFNDLVFPVATVNEDYYIKAQMFVKQATVGYVEEPLYCYEQHPGSLSKQPLSLRALGEFDNAKATWEFITNHAPAYSNQALAIASEAATKWLNALNSKGVLPEEYKPYSDNIRNFIKRNFSAIMLNPYFLWKVKIVMAVAMLHRK